MNIWNRELKKPVRVAVAMSGGVDSLRTAVLLRELGHDVFGIHMRVLPKPRNEPHLCASHKMDPEDNLRELAQSLLIPIQFEDLREAFRERVIEPFLEAYLGGRTPNPCIACNPSMKFGLLLQKARQWGATHLATGHYARILPPDSQSDRFRLCRARDRAKDQSYFLFGLSQEQLASALFPLGSTLKKEVLLWADKAGLSECMPKESQEICFIPSGDYQRFLEEKLGSSSFSTKGPIKDMEGRVLGEHKGIFAYTVGQRRGLGIASTAPYYVVRLDAGTKTVWIGRDRDLLRKELRVERVNWVSVDPPCQPMQCQVRIRNQHVPAQARITVLGNACVLIHFEKPQRAVTPGQAAVFYDGDLVLGGGTIALEPGP